MKSLLSPFLLKRKKDEIAPDEIFLDSSNVPAFDTYQFEGRIETPIRRRSLVALGVFFILIGLVIAAQAWRLQIAQGEAYALLSEKNRLEHYPIFPERGLVYDRNGVSLAWNVENKGDLFSLRGYLDDPGLSHVLGYINYPKRDTHNIFYQMEIIGQTGAEKIFNTLLAGKSGVQIIETNAMQEVESASVIELPRGGEAVTLSIDAKVQTKLYEIYRGACGTSRI